MQSPMKKKETRTAFKAERKKKAPADLKNETKKKANPGAGSKIFEALSKASGRISYIHVLKTGEMNWFGDSRRVFGLPHGKMPNTFEEWKKMIHPDDLKTHLKNFKDSVKKKSPMSSAYRVCPDKKKAIGIYENSYTVSERNKKAYLIAGSISAFNSHTEIREIARGNEKEFLSVVDEMPHFIYRINRKGEIIFANKAYAGSFGLKPEEILGKSAYDLHPAKLADKYTSDNNKVFRSRKTFYAVEDHVQKKNGRKEVVEVIKIPLFDARKRVVGLQGVYWYITDFVEAQENLKGAEKDYKEIFNATSDAIFIHDADTGAIVDVNETACKMYGYTKMEMLRFTVHDISAGDEQYNIVSAVSHIHRSDTSRANTFEWLAKHKSGRLFWVEVSLRKSTIGGKGRVLAVVRDISKRKDDEKALFLSQISINTSKDGVVWFNRDGKIIFVNEAAFGILKYSKREIYNLAIFDVEPALNLMNWNKRLEEMNDSGSLTFETRISDRKKNEIPVEIALNYYKYNNEEIIFSVIRDISERKFSDDRLKESERRYRDITELLPQGIYECDINGTVTYSNKRLFEMLQRTPEELKQGFNVLQALSPEIRSAAAENLKGLLQGREIHPQEYTMLRKDGTSFPGVIYSAVVYDNDVPKGFRGIIVDLSDKLAFEKEKQEHDSLFSLLFEKAGDANLLIEEDCFIDCNETTVRVLLANSKEEVIAKHPSELSPMYQPDGELSSVKADKLIQRAFREGSARFEWVHTKFDGTDFFVEVMLTAIPIKGKWYLHTSWRDITERKQAEEKQRESEERLRTLINAMPDIVCFKDGEGRWMEANEFDLKLFELTNVDYRGKKDCDLAAYSDFYREAFLNCEESDEMAWRAGVTSRMDEIIPRRDGSEMVFDIIKVPMFASDGRRKGLIVVGRDITDKKIAEARQKLYLQRLEKLLEVERSILSTQSTEKIAKSALNHLRVFLNCQRASVILLDKEKDLFTITALDASYKTNVDIGTSFPLEFSPWGKLSSGEVLVINDFLELKDLNPIDEMLLKEGIRSRVSVPLIIDNSVRGTLNLSSVYPDNFNGESIKIVQDVSVSIALAIQHSEFVDKINRQNSELEKMVDERTVRLRQTISELESFSYSVSHDLRAPLRSIGGFSQALIDDYSEKLGEEGVALLNRIVSASHRMSDLIDALLLLARIIRSEMSIESISLSDMVLNAFAEHQKMDGHARNSEIIIQPGLNVKGDPKLIRIAIENLVSNAWKFTKNNDNTLIEFGKSVVDGEDVFFIRDNGVGFDMKYSNKLFGAFQRLHSAEEFEGTGVGLATTKRIILRHGGRIWAESRLNDGTTFYFTLKA